MINLFFIVSLAFVPVKIPPFWYKLIAVNAIGFICNNTGFESQFSYLKIIKIYVAI